MAGSWRRRVRRQEAYAMEYDREQNLDPNRDPYRDPTMDPNRDPSLYSNPDPSLDPTYDPSADPSLGRDRDVEQGDNYDQGIQEDEPSNIDKLKGMLQEGAGKVTGNEDLEAQGRMRQQGGTMDQGTDGYGPGTSDETDLNQ
jgi:uncharacterized protein YjbJ (UPF0337 family)